MRLSTDKSDPDYCAVGGVRVFLDGVEVRGVYTADDQRGLIVQSVFDANGHYQIAPGKDEILKQPRYGAVRIELPAGHPLLHEKGHT